MTKTRLAKPRDAKALSEMNWQFNKVEMKASAISAKLRKDKELVAVVLDADVPVGFACAQVYDSMCYPKRHAEHTELYVKPSHRRKGLAIDLIEYLEKQLIQRTVGHIHILTGIRNKPAQELYERQGYKYNKEFHEVLYEKDIKYGKKQKAM